MVDLKKKYADKDRLRMYRQAMGMTQDDFARMMGVASSTVRNWETGNGSLPGPLLVLIRMGEERGAYPAPPGMSVPVGVGTALPPAEADAGADRRGSGVDEAALRAMSQQERAAWVSANPLAAARLRGDAYSLAMESVAREEDRRYLDAAMEELEELRARDSRYAGLSLGDVLMARGFRTGLDA